MRAKAFNYKSLFYLLRPHDFTLSLPSGNVFFKTVYWYLSVSLTFPDKENADRAE